MSEIKIMKRECYQVSCCKKLYASRRGAAKHVAWRLINEKYRWDLVNVKQAGGMKCKCIQNPAPFFHIEGSNLNPNGCPLHDRRLGYFLKLSRKMTGFILHFKGFNQNTRWFNELKKQ
jgi:hypothetical protein